MFILRRNLRFILVVFIFMVWWGSKHAIPKYGTYNIEYFQLKKPKTVESGKTLLLPLVPWCSSQDPSVQGACLPHTQRKAAALSPNTRHLERNPNGQDLLSFPVYYPLSYHIFPPLSTLSHSGLTVSLGFHFFRKIPYYIKAVLNMCMFFLLLICLLTVSLQSPSQRT